MTTVLKDTPIGPVQLEVGPSGLTQLRFGFDAEARAERGLPESARQVLGAARQQLTQYFAGHRQAFDLPLDLRGTSFQVAVWRAVLEIPFGETASYGEIARKIGKPNAVRAVGAANGANPIAIIVPCHRVVGSDGKLTGYGGGLPIKRRLLVHEGVGLNGDRVVATASGSDQPIQTSLAFARDDS